jgi:signal transduction histidine kinase/ActR/RegA family two-component response regulator
MNSAPLEIRHPYLFDGGLLLAVALAVFIFVGGLFGLAANVDLLAKHREEAQAQNAMRDRVQEVADQVTANTNWDDAVEHASNHYDPLWITENIGLYYSQPRRFRFVILTDPSDRPVFGMDRGKPVDPARFAPLSAAIAPLVANVRAQETLRGPFRQAPRAKRLLSRPIQASDVVRYDGGLFILTATLIQPEFGSFLPAGPRTAIVVTGKPIDATFMASFGQRLLLKNVRLVGPSDTAGAYIDLADQHGARLARIAWSPRHPGADLISIALPAILFGVGAPLALYLHGRRTGRRLKATLVELARARDEADTANAQKSAFLASMSHEIRTPLNGVLAMAQVMEADVLPSAQRERLSVISHSGEALLTIVNDILDLSKIEAGRLELDIRPFDVAGLTQILAALYGPIAEQKGVAFGVEVASDAIGVWRGDPDRLRQVIANLISNALKFTERGEVRVQVLAAAAGLRFEVRDTGIGLADDKLDLVFETFRQADNSTARRYGGTGLGLAISRRLAEIMGGQLWVESRLDVGSVFKLELPLQRLSDAALPVVRTPAVLAERSDRLRILAADDNATNRQVLAAILEPLGFDLYLCEDGEAAMAAWRSGQYDLILMDIQMPVLDGVAATKRIRAEEALTARRHTPIIALTANAMTHQLAEYRMAGMDDCVSKPIRIAELHAALLGVLEPAEASDVPAALEV